MGELNEGPLVAQGNQVVHDNVEINMEGVMQGSEGWILLGDMSFSALIRMPAPDSWRWESPGQSINWGLIFNSCPDFLMLTTTLKLGDSQFLTFRV